MRPGRWLRSPGLPASWLAAASIAALVVGAMATRADGLPARAGALGHDHGFVAAPPASMCTSAASMPAFQREMDAGMERMMQDMHSPGYSGNVDIDFLAMMVPHHQGAVDMARLVLMHGRDPATRMLAEEIIAGQTVEIQSMRRRLAALRQPDTVVADKAFPELGGTRGP